MVVPLLLIQLMENYMQIFQNKNFSLCLLHGPTSLQKSQSVFFLVVGTVRALCRKSLLPYVYIRMARPKLLGQSFLKINESKTPLF